MSNNAVLTLSLAWLTLSFLVTAKAAPLPVKEPGVIYLASLEWPPFTGQELLDGGRTAVLVKRIFHQMGYQVVIDFLPWSRAVKQTTGRAPQYLAYFPEYPLQHDEVKLSGCIGYSHVGLAEHTAAPLQINSSADLQHYRLGVVQDYVNTTTIDQMIRDRRLNVETSLTDKQNLLRLAHQRLDAAVIDYDVMQHLLTTEDELKPFKHQLNFNTAEYELKTLHLAVNINHPDASLLTEFDRHLSQLALQSQVNPELPKQPLDLCQPGLKH
ncbi:transporter substrate-binding domain-containing protein [Rheinheimera nanhaiensis]|uniref:Uncharacterized protein n=1 Tax=Rheinheimera nanhaiensis E407-8 TaxID=562729 RepID=I1DXN9_9GAMM|nr:transporter substrate-binding domain-containing protein [Rheinheimera nanhaiensis]GAB58817.1 hypothetical protein RNAN_1805 [Rheinheimera nanhaiensis E407-8]